MFNASKAGSASIKFQQHYPLDSLLDLPVEKPIKTASPSVGRVIHKNFTEGIIPFEMGVVPHGVFRELTKREQPGSHDPAAKGDASNDHALKHWFSRPLAVDIGIPDAILLKFLSHKITRSKNLRDGKFWFYDAIPMIAQHYPYLTASAVEEAMRRNDRKGLILRRSDCNRHRRDRTTWYSMPMDVMNRAEKELISFHVDDAVAFDLPTAVLLEHLLYWSGRAVADDPDCGGEFRFSPTESSRYLPLSKASIERKLHDLQERGALERRGKVDNVGVFALTGNWADRVRPIVAPAKPLRPSKKSIRETTITKANLKVAPTVPTPPDGPCRWNRERINRLISENERILAGLNAQDRASAIQGSYQDADRYLDAVKEQKLLSEYWKLPSPDDLMDRVEVDRKTPAFNVREDLYSLTLERLCLVFFLGRPECFPSSHDQKPGDSYFVRIQKVQTPMQEELREAALLRYEEHRREHESQNKDKEELTEITPAEKVRVLRNGINAVNVQGFLDWTNRIKPRNLTSDVNALEAAERFFVDNLAWTPGNLIRVMVASDSFNEDSPSEGGHDERWHARQGHNLRFLLCHMESVLQGLNLAGEMPPVIPVPKEILFPKTSRLPGDAPLIPPDDAENAGLPI